MWEEIRQGGRDDCSDGESLLVMDLAGNGVGVVGAGAFYVVFGKDSGE